MNICEIKNKNETVRDQDWDIDIQSRCLSWANNRENEKILLQTAICSKCALENLKAMGVITVTFDFQSC